MSVSINIHPILQHFTGDQNMVEVSGSTVGQCLEQLVTRFPEVRERLFDKEGKLFDHIEIYVNGESTYPEELSRTVKDGDELHIIMIIAGG